MGYSRIVAVLSSNSEILRKKLENLKSEMKSVLLKYILAVSEIAVKWEYLRTP